MKYRPDASGLRQIGMSAEMQAASVAAAQRVASKASGMGEDTYTATGRVLPAGWQNENRGGAAITATEGSVADARKRVLLTALQRSTVNP